jgi:pyrimidine operon attenuation protein/uracil phosphoribosyltransferase
MKTQILAHVQVQKIIKRMAYQIYEKHFDQKELLFAAVHGQGIEIAKLVQAELISIAKIKISLVVVKLSKDNPSFNAATVEMNAKQCKGKSVI